jgi:hypothetical protein
MIEPCSSTELAASAISDSGSSISIRQFDAEQFLLIGQAGIVSCQGFLLNDQVRAITDAGAQSTIRFAVIDDAPGPPTPAQHACVDGDFGLCQALLETVVEDLVEGLAVMIGDFLSGE